MKMRLLAASIVLAALLSGCMNPAENTTPPETHAAEAEISEAETPEAETLEPEASEPEPILYRDFTAYRQDGTAVKISDYIGTPMVLNFWTTWCGPCREEMPHFDKIEKEFEDVLFFMVNLTDGESETTEKVESFLTESGFTFKNVLLDTDADAYTAYGISSIPVTLFINADGHIVDGKLGKMEESKLRSAIEALVAETQ